MSIGGLTIIALTAVFLGGVGGWPAAYGYGAGHGGVGVVGALLAVVIVLTLMGRL